MDFRVLDAPGHTAGGNVGHVRGAVYVPEFQRTGFGAGSGVVVGTRAPNNFVIPRLEPRDADTAFASLRTSGR